VTCDPTKGCVKTAKANGTGCGTNAVCTNGTCGCGSGSLLCSGTCVGTCHNGRLKDGPCECGGVCCAAGQVCAASDNSPNGRRCMSPGNGSS
jgi:hypothetical protein